MAQKTNHTNDLTNAIILFLSHNGFKVWRNNTVGVFDPQKQVFRKNKNTLKGVPDIIGFRKIDGKFIGVEIKTGSDKLSIEQNEFLTDLKKSGGIAIVAKTIDDFLAHKNELLLENPYKDFLEKVYNAMQKNTIKKEDSLKLWERFLL